MPPISISILREHQKACRQILGITADRTEKEVLKLALKRAQEREEQSMFQGEFVRDGVFKYPIHLEKIRWRRTRDIIRRVMPGMDEDPVYLEMLARQAASIEIILRQEHADSPNPKASALCEQILLGTTAVLDPSAFSGPAGDHVMVVLSNGIISFLYQVAKAVVLSWRPVKARQGSSVAFRWGPEDIDFVLSKGTHPLELLYKTLYTYIYNGRPRAVGFDPPAAEYHPPLSMLTNFDERFVIAHEYGHALLHQMDSIGVLPPDSKSWQKEFEADSFAFLFTIRSAQELDFVPANIALQGAFFSLSGFEVIRKTLDIARFGDVKEDKGVATHPPTQQRIEVLKQLYRKHVGSDENDILAIEGALGPSMTLNLLWDRIRGRFIETHRRGIKPHPIWA